MPAYSCADQVALPPVEIDDLHSKINAYACRMRGVVTLVEALQAGEVRHDASTIRTMLNRLTGELADFLGDATDALTGTITNTEGAPETFLAACMNRIAENRLAAAARHASLDAGFHSSVGA